MPNYNHGHFIGQALQSVLAQSWRPIEVIVLDDASTDDSVEVVRRMAARDPIVRLERHEQNQGVIAAGNRLLDLASGDYVVFVASDDAVLPGFFERSMAMLAAHPAAGLCSALVLAMDAQGGAVRYFRTTLASTEPTYLDPDQVRAAFLSSGNWIIGNTAVFRRDALIAAGGFRPELRSFTDGFVEQVLALRHGVCFLPEPLAVWRLMPSGYSSATQATASEREAMIEAAVALMTSAEFGPLFPFAYVDGWRREVHLAAAIEAARARLHEPLGAIARASWQVTRALLFARHRPFQVVRRRWRWLRTEDRALRSRVDDAVAAFVATQGSESS